MSTPLLSSLLLRWEEAFALGTDLPAADLCPGRPDLAEPLARAIAVVRAARLARRDMDTPELPAPSLADIDEVPTDAVPSPPGYDVLHELGRGGMAVVHLARHQALGRLTAVKAILPGRATPAMTDLFVREARAVAALQHPNIVGLFEIGEHRGSPYFALEYCEGGSLADRLGGTPLDPREAARIVETMSRAMHAAHEAGIVHRDLKPANVLFTKDGTLKVSDFGLVKQADSAGEADRSGVIVGTPAYMPPEQARGNRALDHRADVYSLGATLYECLTGRPPFRSATAFDTLEQVIRNDPAPPMSLNPRVPIDLDTVCRMCLQKDPSRRYASAADLADDLGRFLRGEPVKARRVGVVEQAAKWARRRPLAASLVGTLTAVVTSSLVVISALYGSAVAAEKTAREEADRATTAEIKAARERDNAIFQRDRAEANLASAKRAVDECFVVARKHPLLAADSMRRVRLLLLEKALPFYRDFRAQRPDDTSLSQEQAQNFVNAAFILAETGRKREAATEYRKGIAQLREVAAARPDDIFPACEAARNTVAVALIEAELGDHPKALALLDEADGVFAEWQMRRPKSAALLADRAGVASNRALANTALGRDAEVKKDYLRARDIHRALFALSPTEEEYRVGLAVSLYNVVNCRAGSDRAGDLKALDEAVALLQAVASDPNAERRDHAAEVAARCLSAKGLALEEMEKPAEAVEAFAKSAESLRELVRRSPDVPRFAVGLAGTLGNLGNLYGRLGDDGKSVASFEEARSAVAPLAAKFPDVVDHRLTLAAIDNNLGDAHRNARRLGKAIASQTASVKGYAAAAAKADTIETARLRQMAVANLGNMYEDAGKFKEAVATRSEALSLAQKLCKRAEAKAEDHGKLAKAYHHLGESYNAAGDGPRAAATYEAGMALVNAEIAAGRADHSQRRALGAMGVNKAQMLHAAGKVTEAVAALRSVRKELEAAVAAEPKNADGRNYLSTLKVNLGLLLAESRDAGAEKLLGEGIDLRRGLMRELPDDRSHAGALGPALAGRAQLRAMKGRLAEARTDIDEALRLLDGGGTPETGEVPRLVAMWQMSARIHRAMKEAEKAVACWDRVVAIVPRDEVFSMRMARASVMAREGMHERALAEMTELEKFPGLPGDAWYDMACTRTLAALAAERDVKRPLAWREREAEVQRRAAVALLKRAKAAGYFKDAKARKEFAADDDFDSVRGREDFRAVAAEVGR